MNEDFELSQNCFFEMKLGEEKSFKIERVDGTMA